MTQTFLTARRPGLFTRLGEWFLALREEDAPRDTRTGQPQSEEERARERDDGFYLALGLYGHW